ncbi:MAG TPA: hypothetical protein VFB81_04530 [Myxococcales bacterium]|nr:hypothetical protein [Myxococcales bacterium]
MSTNGSSSMSTFLRLRRLARRAGTEIVVALFALAAAFQLVALREPVLALGTLAAGALTSVAAITFLLRRGELQLAWRCPHLDRLGVSIESADAPWSALLQADGAVAALDEASSRFPAFFPDGRRDLLRGAHRAVDVHRARARALSEACRLPDGFPRRGLLLRAAKAGEELQDLERSLGEIRSRLVESATAPRCLEGEAALTSLAERTAALAEAVTEIGSADILRPLPVGERA